MGKVSQSLIFEDKGGREGQDPPKMHDIINEQTPYSVTRPDTWYSWKNVFGADIPPTCGTNVAENQIFVFNSFWTYIAKIELLSFDYLY